MAVSGEVLGLVKYDAACRALAEAKNVDEAREIRNRADALRVYAKQAKNKQLEIDAAEIRFRAERRVGELMQAQRETVGLAKGGATELRAGPDGTRSFRCLACRHIYSDPPGHICHEAKPTLAEAGIDKHLADRARKMAAVPREEFEAEVSGWRERVSHETARVTTNLMARGEQELRRPLSAPSNGLQFARLAIMNLEQVRQDDLERADAFALVREWLDAREA